MQKTLKTNENIKGCEEVISPRKMIGNVPRSHNVKLE